jgi:membrane protease YdiL (CAAX protease family)
MTAKRQIEEAAGPRSMFRGPEWDYLTLAFGISWVGALCLALPWLLRGQPVPKFTGLMMFPVMLLGPSLAGAFMIWRTGAKWGMAEMFRSLRRTQFAPGWWAALLIPPVLVLIVLESLRALVGAGFAPNFFVAGFGFGIIAGFVEEIGWTGFAFPWMARKRTAFRAAVELGLLWALWHLPVIDYLGTATPHGPWLAAYFLAFAGVVSAMRVLIAWLYVNTRSLLLAQLMHAASTGALVVLSPASVSAAQEALWYAYYGAALWLIVAGVRLVQGSGLIGR